MKIQVDVISREMIKPSSPTPHHLSTYQLSFLDQISPPIFMPLIYFYAGGGTTDRSEQLKKSLSEALTLFYPLAGRVKDNEFIDCNDEGVPYVEARVNCQLSDFIVNPQPSDINPLLPYELDDVQDLCAAVQFNIFDCGGLALTLLVSHKPADALSFFLFSNTWAAMLRLDVDIVHPRFDSAKLFPPVPGLPGFKPTIGIMKESLEARRFVFSASTVASLRDKYTDYSNIEQPRRPTRVEALSALIFSRFMAATQNADDISKRLYTAGHAVNLRTRMDPPLPENYFGNISRSVAWIVNTETKEDGYGLVKGIRDEIRSINKEFISKLQEAKGYLSYMRERSQQVTKGEVLSFSFTSLCRFPMYEVDFGWGKPIWVGSARLNFKNLVTFVDAKSGGGIEAWINLKAEDMKKFEVDEEFLSYVSSSRLDYSSF